MSLEEKLKEVSDELRKKGADDAVYLIERLIEEKNLVERYANDCYLLGVLSEWGSVVNIRHLLEEELEKTWKEGKIDYSEIAKIMFISREYSDQAVLEAVRALIHKCGCKLGLPKEIS